MIETPSPHQFGRERSLARSSEAFFLHLRSSRTVVLPAIVLGVVLVYLFIYATGGIKHVYAEAMYIPILLGGISFGIPGGILTGLAGGIVLGPLMPLDVISGEPQGTVSWVVRAGFFLLVGFLNGGAVQVIARRLEQSEWKEKHSPDTGLPSRSLMIETLSSLNGATDRTELHIVSASNLGEINAAFGIEAGDTIMRQMARRLQEAVDGDVSVFHHHPEQLGLIVQGYRPEESGNRIERIEKCLEEPFACGDVLLHVEPRLEHVLPGKLGGNPIFQLRRAELAMHKSRENGRGPHVGRQELEGSVRENMRILGALERAIERGELCLHYQPKVSLKDRRVTGVEALVRWNRSDGGMIPPGLFIPQVEQSNLIHPLTEWVLDTALGDLARWEDEGISMTLAVNVSTRNLVHPAFQSSVIGALERHRVNPSRLELEVMESAVMRDPARASRLLERLANARIAIALDDFGLGHSSLAFLSRFPVSSIKIDQAFIRRLRPASGDAHVVDAAIHLAHALNMQVVGEGVETEQAFRWLGERGCDLAQGYHIGRPMPPDELPLWFNRYGNRVASAEISN